MVENSNNSENNFSILENIDFDLLKSQNYDDLILYAFPLIERLIIEILKFNSISDIEVSTQGTYKTLNSVINSNELHLSINDIQLLKELFKDDGVRNKLMHVSDEIVEIDIAKIEEMRALIFVLIDKLKEIEKDFLEWKWKPIENIPIQ